MRCEYCPDADCALRLTAGECRIPRSLQVERGIDINIRIAASDLVTAVERYVEPKPGDAYCSRNEVLLAKNNLKKLLNDEK